MTTIAGFRVRVRVSTSAYTSIENHIRWSVWLFFCISSSNDVVVVAIAVVNTVAVFVVVAIVACGLE